MRRLLLTLGIAVLVISTWVALTHGQITPVQRNVLYVHVPNSVFALLCFGILMVASIVYLVTGRDTWDFVAAASGEVGLVLTTILNATGMVFSRAEWNVWWTPSPRLVSSALLWFLYAVYLILRVSLAGSFRRRARICAVFAIIGFVDVPMVLVSARFLRDIHRPSFSFDSAWQIWALTLGMVGTGLLAAGLIWLRTDGLKCDHKLQKQLEI